MALNSMAGQQAQRSCESYIGAVPESASGMHSDLFELSIARYMHMRGLLQEAKEFPAVLPPGVAMLVVLRRDEAAFVQRRDDDVHMPLVGQIPELQETRHLLQVQYCNSSVAGSCARNLSAAHVANGTSFPEA